MLAQVDKTAAVYKSQLLYLGFNTSGDSTCSFVVLWLPQRQSKISLITQFWHYEYEKKKKKAAP